MFTDLPTVVLLIAVVVTVSVEITVIFPLPPSEVVTVIGSAVTVIAFAV